jgi:hypothetical protein
VSSDFYSGSGTRMNRRRNSAIVCVVLASSIKLHESIRRGPWYDVQNLAAETLATLDIVDSQGAYPCVDTASRQSVSSHHPSPYTLLSIVNRGSLAENIELVLGL